MLGLTIYGIIHIASAYAAMRLVAKFEESHKIPLGVFISMSVLGPAALVIASIMLSDELNLHVPVKRKEKK